MSFSPTEGRSFVFRSSEDDTNIRTFKLLQPCEHLTDLFYSLATLLKSASYGGLAQWQQALDDAKECIRLDPTFVKGYYRLAAAQIEVKDFDGAIATIRQGLAIDANNPQLSKQMRIVQQQKKVALAKAQAPVTAASGQQLDAATTRELQDLQIQYNQSNRDLSTVQANLVKTQREHKVSEITTQELQEIPEDTKCYRSIGKMFLRSTKQGVLNHLNESMEKNKKMEADMTKKMEYLERQLKSQRQNIEELIASPGAPSSTT